MNTLRFSITACAVIFWATTALTQGITCDTFTITSIEPDTFDVGNTLVNIQMEGSDMNFINYPYIPLVLDCTGDSVATGSLSFFGQIGQTTQGYPVSLLDADVCFPITIQFVYGNEQLLNDTCLLTYGTSGLSIAQERDHEMNVYPNPTAGHVQLGTTSSLVGEPYVVLNQLGSTVLQGVLLSMNTRLELSEMSAGIYIVRVGAESTRMIRVVKE
jgi:hypothetical protein